MNLNDVGKIIKRILFVSTILLLSCLVIYELRESVTESDEGDELFSVIYTAESKQQIKGFYSEEILYFCVPGYMEFQDVKLKIRESYQLVIGDLVFENGDSLLQIKTDQLYDVSYGRKGKDKKSFQVIFMQGSHLPIVRVNTTSGNLDYIHSQKGNSESGFMQVYDADGKLLSITDVKSMKGRGNTAWDAIKKSYTLHLDDAADILGMGSDKVWVLNANWYDGAYIRNQIGFEVAKSAGIENTPEACFVELYVNDEYMGLYQIMEKIKTGKNRIDIRDDYLLEIDFRFRVGEEENHIMLSNEQPIIIHSPEKNVDVEGVQCFFDEFSSRMEQGDIPLDLIDLESFAKMFVMEDFLQDMDFGYSSHYMILGLEEGILSEGPVWDMDNTLGRGIATQAKPLFVTNYD